MSARRATDYSQELADKICAEIALGYSLRTISKAESMPCVVTIFNWLRIHREFLEQYTRMTEEQADALAEEMFDIADDGTNDWFEWQGNDSQAPFVLNSEHVQRSRLRIGTRKWIASMLKPTLRGAFSTPRPISQSTGTRLVVASPSAFSSNHRGMSRTRISAAASFAARALR